ncbi:MAG: helix-turn-helix domain-containing protein [Alphaproteobacteria bacterium]
MIKDRVIDQYVGERVRIRRVSLGLSQQAVAARLGLTFQQIQKYEKGKNRIGSSRLYQLSKLLNVDVGWFFEGLDAGEETLAITREIAAAFDSVSPQFGSREFVELNRAYWQIPGPEVRQTILRLIELIADEQESTEAA